MTTWRRTFIARGPHGEMCERYDSAEHPRVFRMVQTDAEGAVIDLYYVENIHAQHYHSLRDAVEAAEANP